MPDTDIHAAGLVDLPLVRRLAEKGTLLDCELCYTGETVGPHGALLSSMLPQRSLHTLVGRVGRRPMLGQFRLKPNDHLAQMVYIAPRLESCVADTAWLHLIDAMAAEAGRRGMHMLTGEVDEDSPLFITLRTAGFAVYARQEIWERPAGMGLPKNVLTAPLAVETDDDTMDIQLLYSNIVPRLVQPIALPSRDSTGLVYRQHGRVKGYVAVSEGRCGTYLMPFLHPDIFSEAAAIIAGVLERVDRGGQQPVYVCVRRYQDWLEEPLTMLGFTSGRQQALMVRHIAAGVRRVNLAPIKQTLEAIPSVATPPTTHLNAQAPLVWEFEQTGEDYIAYGTSDY
ncbi:MAG: hypothetical protein GYB67_16615 [Chloroflexi bacterium]|nr:hypothetical protein [Chloroflexota bacterium]